MKIPPPLPGRPPVLFALLIALLSLGVIWFTAAFLLPKAEYNLSVTPPYSPVPLGGAMVVGAWQPLSYAAGGGLLLTVLLAGAALLPPLSAGILRRTAWALQGLALLLFCSVLYLALATFFALIWGNMSAQMKLGSYRRELELFGLAEAAEGRHERFNAVIERLSSRKPRLARSEEEMGPQDRRARLATLTELLGKTSDPGMRKRILATLPLFRKTLGKDHRSDHPFLRHGRELSGEDFTDMKALLAWLSTAPKEDGWEPLPIYTFE